MRKLLAAIVLSLALSCSAQQWHAPKDAGPRMPANRFAQDEGWWQRAVFYEVYPRSFADSNNDGTGDLKGILSRLDYLQSLGVDAVWITPVFPSPQVDFGYDVSDYRDIDPQYGTLADMDLLIAEGKKRGIKVVLDLVVNHTSDKHRWFQESRKSRDNPYRDYYIWRDGKGKDTPPTNWTSIFGGPSWTADAATNQWYYHFFYPQQPDLNWRNPQVEKEVFDVTRWWYQRGVYGFRLDAVNTMYEDPQLRDNPPAEGTDPYGMPNQKKIYDVDLLPEIHAALQRLRKVADEYPGRVLIGETWTDSEQKLAEYYGPKNNELHMPMYFNFMMIDKLDPATFRKRIAAIERNPVGGWPVYVLSNHDKVRYVDRYTPKGAPKPEVAKLMGALLMTLRGTPILYYGDEIGMENNDPKRREDVKDVVGRLGWPKEKGRDGERTPMQWDASVNAGFNRGAKPWLPVHPNYKTLNVKAQSAQPHSVLNWFRKLVSLRRTQPALYEGSYVALDEENRKVMSFARKSNGQTIVVAINTTGAHQTVSFDLAKIGAKDGQVLATTGKAKRAAFSKLTLEPYGVVIAEAGK